MQLVKAVNGAATLKEYARLVAEAHIRNAKAFAEWHTENMITQFDAMKEGKQ